MYKWLMVSLKATKGFIIPIEGIRRKDLIQSYIKDRELFNSPDKGDLRKKPLKGSNEYFKGSIEFQYR